MTWTNKKEGSKLRRGGQRLARDGDYGLIMALITH